MKPSGLVTSGGVRRHTIRRNRKITKAALAGRLLPRVGAVAQRVLQGLRGLGPERHRRLAGNTRADLEDYCEVMEDMVG